MQSTDTPRVSIVIPVYNGANYMATAIDSALAQTHPDTEVVVVDDGSTDGGRTEAIARGYGDRIRYVKKANGGVATALNAGIAAMTGDYFSWLSHDDVYLPDKVAAQVKAARELGPDPVVIYSAFQEIDPAGAVLGDSLGSAGYDDAILAVFAAAIHGCSLLIPRACFEAVGVFNEGLETTPDADLWLRIALAGYRFHYLPRVLIQSRQHAEQGSRTITRHVQHRHEWYRWALDELGRQERAARSAALPPILIRRDELGAFLQLVRLSAHDQGRGTAARLLARHTPALAGRLCWLAVQPVYTPARALLRRAAIAAGLKQPRGAAAAAR